MMVLLIIASALGLLSFLIWLIVCLHPARPWDCQPVGDDAPAPAPGDAAWPAVCALVPARNEAATLPRTLAALLRQDYPGPLQVILIDDRSTDGTAEMAKRIADEAGACGAAAPAAPAQTPVRPAAKLTVLTGAPLPAGWVGKVWALEQGLQHVGRAADAQYVLLTDADILHALGSLRRLVGESRAHGWALNSRMARLRCESPAEKLLIPAFVFFFNLLYPMRQVNDPRSRVAAAAGGCMLLSREALGRLGGLACIRDRIIDDVSLARKVKGLGLPVHLALSRTEVVSTRAYEGLASVWRMVSRTAFTELGHSWVRLAGVLVGLALMFALPPALVAAGLCSRVALAGGAIPAEAANWMALAALLGLAVWAVQVAVYRPMVKFYGLPSCRAWLLPLAGLLYGLMTLDSALRWVTGRAVAWRAQNDRV